MVYFLSDIHLGARYIDDPRGHERRIVDFIHSIASDATEVYLLGDILDYWYEYKTVVPRGYIRFFGAIAALTDAGVKVTWITGNHDIWLFDYIRDELGVEVIDAPAVVKEICGKTFVLAHGDRVGERKLSFRIICRVFRNRLAQWLYGAIHPRWTIPFAHRWSSSSRISNNDDSCLDHHIDIIMNDAKDIKDRFPQAQYIVLGHHHLMLDREIKNDTRLIVLGDWITHDSYACYDGNELTLKQCQK